MKMQHLCMQVEYPVNLQSLMTLMSLSLLGNVTITYRIVNIIKSHYPHVLFVLEVVSA